MLVLVVVLVVVLLVVLVVVLVVVLLVVLVVVVVVGPHPPWTYNESKQFSPGSSPGLQSSPASHPFQHCAQAFSHQA